MFRKAACCLGLGLALGTWPSGAQSLNKKDLSREEIMALMRSDQKQIKRMADEREALSDGTFDRETVAQFRKNYDKAMRATQLHFEKMGALLERGDVEDISEVDGREEDEREESNPLDPQAEVGSAKDMPWYPHAMELLTKWKFLSEEEKTQSAEWIRRQIREFPLAAAAQRAREKGHASPALKTAPGNEDEVPVIIVRKYGGSTKRDVASARSEALVSYFERVGGFKVTPELRAGLTEKIAPQLLKNLNHEAPRTPAEAVAKISELREIFSGSGAVPPIRDFVAQTQKAFSAPVATSYTRGGPFKKGKLSVGAIRLCESALFENPEGNSLNRACKARDGRWSSASMTKLSKAYNKLDDAQDRTQFWTALYSCLAYQESGMAWEQGADKKVDPLKSHSGASFRRIIASLDPNRPETWYSEYGFGDDGTMQFSACQANAAALGYEQPLLSKGNSDREKRLANAVGCDPMAGNVSPCIEAWNEQNPQDAVARRTHLVRGPKGSTVKVNGYDLVDLQARLVAKDQNFNRFCGIQKLFSNLQAQYDAGFKDGDGKRCASPFNQFYNHFGSLMCQSQGFTDCMAKFVDYKAVSVRTDLIHKLLDYYEAHSRGKETPAPSPTH